MSRSHSPFDRGFFGALVGFVHGFTICACVAIPLTLVVAAVPKPQAVRLLDYILSVFYFVPPVAGIIGAVRAVRAGPPTDDAAPLVG